MVDLFGTTREMDALLTLVKCPTLSFASLMTRWFLRLRWRDAALPIHAQWLKDNNLSRTDRAVEKR